jgi:CHAD domain-containing protein
MRVAVRRSRALLRAGRPLIATDTGVLFTELKWLGEVLGSVRDLDVLLARLRDEAVELGGDDEQAAVRLLRNLTRERKRARTAMLRALATDRYLGLVDLFGAELDGLAPTGADMSLDAVARRELKKLRKAVRALPEQPLNEELHHLRKLGKHARYAAELAQQRNVAQSAKLFQDVLGEHQDSTVAEARLRSISEKVPPSEALAAGRLIERERVRQAHARASWRGAWRKLERSSR